jgi:hypothetical protein
MPGPQSRRAQPAALAEDALERVTGGTAPPPPPVGPDLNPFGSPPGGPVFPVDPGSFNSTPTGEGPPSLVPGPGTEGAGFVPSPPPTGPTGATGTTGSSGQTGATGTTGGHSGDPGETGGMPSPSGGNGVPTGMGGTPGTDPGVPEGDPDGDGPNLFHLPGPTAGPNGNILPPGPGGGPLAINVIEGDPSGTGQTILPPAPPSPQGSG